MTTRDNGTKSKTYVINHRAVPEKKSWFTIYVTGDMIELLHLITTSEIS